ncbi:hypothetical protein QWA68_015938, partial [Fusarium oxysporum]
METFWNLNPVPFLRELITIFAIVKLFWTAPETLRAAVDPAP